MSYRFTWKTKVSTKVNHLNGHILVKSSHLSSKNSNIAHTKDKKVKDGQNLTKEKLGINTKHATYKNREPSKAYEIHIV